MEDQEVMKGKKGKGGTRVDLCAYRFLSLLSLVHTKQLQGREPHTKMGYAGRYKNEERWKRWACIEGI